MDILGDILGDILETTVDVVGSIAEEIIALDDIL